MAIHRDLNPDFRKSAALVAMAALSEARGQQTAPNGTVSVRNADGTRTVIGAGAGADETGAPMGVRQFVGDTTPPGRPTGVSWLSVDGTVTGIWDGTLEGGVPADLDHVELRAGGLVVGRLDAAGSCSAAAEVGKSYDCYAVAEDVSGNASAESAHEEVTCRDLAAEAQRVADAAQSAADAAKAAADRAQSDVDGAAKSLQETEAKAQAAKDAAAEARSRAEAVASDLDATKATVEAHTSELGELSTKVSNAASDASSALAASTEARQTATEASSTAKSAYKDSQTALTQSTAATQTATKAQTTAESAAETASDSLKQSSQATQTANELSTKLTTEYQTKADADKKYATQASLKATSDSIATSVSKTYATKATVDALQNIADNAIESWRGTGVPTASNKPASDWTTAALRKRHNGDLYYDKATGKAYRWGTDDGTTYTWELNQDSDVTKALADASKAQSTASGAATAASKAQSTADSATTKANAAQSSADTAKSAADGAASAASKAQGDVDKLKVDIPATYVTKSAFEQTSDSITASVTKAQQTADSAVSASSKAQQTADGISAELSKNYQTKAQADGTYATQASLKATSESLSASVTKAQGTADGAVTAASKAQQTADAVSLNLSKNYTSTADADKKYATQASLKATSDSIATSVSKTYATKATVDALQNIADNAIESWRGTGVPTASNKPASDWTTAALRKRHNGDLYYDKATGKAYRWGTDDGTTYTWELNQDSDVTKALADASKAQSTASGAATAASKAQSTADSATTKANAAQSSADTAKSAADGAASAASKAQGDVDKLKVDIPATYVTKSAFEQTSDSITASVTKAQQTADSAVSASSKAQQTADGISAELSKNYQTKAQADGTYATQASLKATSESLSASVTKAQGTADGAVTAASKAQQTADAVSLNLSKNYTSTADADKKYATQASLKATSDSIATSVSKTYATKDALASTDSNVSKAQSAASSAASAASSAASAAKNAQSTADAAKTSAATAQTAANAATTKANSAQSTADTAKANAKTAQDGVDALKGRVATAETSIKQNADAIALRATKTELSGYAKNIIALVNGNGSSDNYLKIATFTVKGSNVNAAIRVSCTSRNNRQTDIIIRFGNSSSTDPTLSSFTRQGSIRAWLAKTATSTWVMYVLKTESYENLWVVGYSNPYSNVAVTWGGGNVAKLPTSNIYEAVEEIGSAKRDDYYTKVQTDAQIKVSADSITSTVSKTYQPKGDYATASQLSQVKQTADGLTTTIKSTVASVKVEYALGASQTTPPASGWSTTAPAWQSGKYMWQRTTATTQGGANSVSATCIQGAKGETGATGPKGDGLDIKDTRSTNQPPSWYFSNYPRTTVNEFKNCSAIGLSNVGTHCNMITYVPWCDSSGGYPKQTAKVDGTGKEYWRVGTSASAWSAWQDALGVANAANANANSAASAAKNAQSTADTAKANAATANSNATNAQSRVGTIETLVRASGNGVEVAKKVNGSYTSTKTLMDDTGFSVLDKAGTVLSKFADKLIQLGRNSSEAVIELCGGNGTIRYFPGPVSPSKVASPGIVIASKVGDSTKSVQLISTLNLDNPGNASNKTGVVETAVGAAKLKASYQNVYQMGSTTATEASRAYVSVNASSSSSVVAISGDVLELNNSWSAAATSVPLFMPWTNLWVGENETRYVRWCVRMGVCYLEAYRVDSITTDGWCAGKLPASCAPFMNTYIASSTGRQDHTAHVWVGGRKDGGDDLGAVWLYSNGVGDVYCTTSWAIG